MVKLKYKSNKNKINKRKSRPIHFGGVHFLASTWLASVDFTPAFYEAYFNFVGHSITLNRCSSIG